MRSPKKIVLYFYGHFEWMMYNRLKLIQKYSVRSMQINQNQNQNFNFQLSFLIFVFTLTCRITVVLLLLFFKIFPKATFINFNQFFGYNQLGIFDSLISNIFLENIVTLMWKLLEGYFFSFYFLCHAYLGGYYYLFFIKFPMLCLFGGLLCIIRQVRLIGSKNFLASKPQKF